MDGKEALAVQVDKLEDRVDREGKINAKEHDNMNERLDKVLGEALKRWPTGVGVALSVLSAVCGGLAVWAFTHAPK
jgi:hypothetical protein